MVTGATRRWQSRLPERARPRALRTDTHRRHLRRRAHAARWFAGRDHAGSGTRIERLAVSATQSPETHPYSQRTIRERTAELAEHEVLHLTCFDAELIEGTEALSPVW